MNMLFDLLEVQIFSLAPCSQTPSVCIMQPQEDDVIMFQLRMVGWLFRAHGEFCASHPWEVIVATLTLTVCMVTVDQRRLGLPSDPHMGCGWRHDCVGLEVLVHVSFLYVISHIFSSVELSMYFID
jgi:hypothetical protein